MAEKTESAADPTRASTAAKSDEPSPRTQAATQAVNEWFLQFSNGPLSRSTDAYNQVFAAKGDLVKRILALG